MEQLPLPMLALRLGPEPGFLDRQTQDLVLAVRYVPIFVHKMNANKNKMASGICVLASSGQCCGSEGAEGQECSSF